LNCSRRIQWTSATQLEDLDFADKLATLSSNHKHIQENTDRLNSYIKQSGLNINTRRSEVMYINTTSTTSITINGEPLEFVEDFTYLGSLISNDN